jgi:biopolymer transport protein ExbD
MAMSAGSAEGEPMMDINTTPLIDVMLVLLIMFIITIPIQTHAVKIDLPQRSNNKSNIDPIKNVVYIFPNDAITWNGVPVDYNTLLSNMQQSQAISPVPELRLQPDAQARFEVVNQVLLRTKVAGVTKLGFVGNEQYQQAF